MSFTRQREIAICKIYGKTLRDDLCLEDNELRLFLSQPRHSPNSNVYYHAPDIAAVGFIVVSTRLEHVASPTASGSDTRLDTVVFYLPFRCNILLLFYFNIKVKNTSNFK